MTNKLAENIRAFRKARSLTQEQLAEVLGGCRSQSWECSWSWRIFSTRLWTFCLAMK